jgi:hypothetical protein
MSFVQMSIRRHITKFVFLNSCPTSERSVHSFVLFSLYNHREVNRCKEYRIITGSVSKEKQKTTFQVHHRLRIAFFMLLHIAHNCVEYLLTVNFAFGQLVDA